MSQQGSKKQVRKRRFVNDVTFQPYTRPNMVELAQDLLTRDDQTEEGFLGAQAVLLLNGLL